MPFQFILQIIIVLLLIGTLVIFSLSANTYNILLKEDEKLSVVTSTSGAKALLAFNVIFAIFAAFAVLYFIWIWLIKEDYKVKIKNQIPSLESVCKTYYANQNGAANTQVEQAPVNNKLASITRKGVNNSLGEIELTTMNRN